MPIPMGIHLVEYMECIPMYSSVCVMYKLGVCHICFYWVYMLSAQNIGMHSIYNPFQLCIWGHKTKQSWGTVTFPMLGTYLFECLYSQCHIAYPSLAIPAICIYVPLSVPVHSCIFKNSTGFNGENFSRLWKSRLGCERFLVQIPPDALTFWKWSKSIKTANVRKFYLCS